MVSDITFIGSGISSSFTILHLLDRIEADRPKKTLTINVIDKYSEFNTGIPYGSRSGYSVLLITSLKNFLPEPEYSKFVAWLNNNKTWLLDEFTKEGGALSERWVLNHAEQIKYNDWGDLFIPRRFFGCYISEKVKSRLKHFQGVGLISVDFISSKVLDIEKNRQNFKLSLANGTEVVSKKVVLAVGSLPVNYLWKHKSFIKKDNLLFINDPYKPTLNKTLAEVDDFLEKRTNKKTNVVIVGANASGLEMLYKLNDLDWNKARINNFTLLSSQGLLPDAKIDFERQKHYTPRYLKALKTESNLTASDIGKAAFKDLDEADRINLGAASTVSMVSSAFGSLLGKLNTEERKKFACHYGNEIGRRQRCAGLHYSDIVDDLKATGRFIHIAGRYSNIENEKDSNEYKLEYLDTKSGQNKFYDQKAHILINCIGSMTLSNNKIPQLLKNLIEKGYCKPNESQIGFEVNEFLEAIENLHIVGPLLAGNVIEEMAVWHVEHCGRIIWLSDILSEKLHRDFCKSKKAIQENDILNTLEEGLIVRNIESESDIKNYKELLRKHWNNNIYYSYEHLKYFENDSDSLKYFLYQNGGEPIVMMTFILRRITMNNIQTPYFDVITPYGYSGPLYNDNVPSAVLTSFWQSVDSWYKENRVITEFVRFSLNGNFKNYTGNLINSLNNVSGSLLDSFEDQWRSFVPKVRNNYRKAVSNNLSFKVFDQHEITEDIIACFHKIYLGTMDRNNASKTYFFSWTYFKNLIMENLNSFSIALVYHEQTPISTELIISYNETVFAFLGGTESEFYKYRPNDFLRVEVVKWAIRNKKKNYVLGGGIKDGDGLYKHKKSLFAKDRDIVFYTGRKIIDHNVYKNLVLENGNFKDLKEIEEIGKNYFPLYRNGKDKKNDNVQSSNFTVIKDKDEWRNLLNEVGSYDFYHTYDYHQLAKSEDEEPILVKYIEGDKVIGLPMLKRKIYNTDHYDITSVYGYAGPVQKNIDASFDNTKFSKLLNLFFKDQNIVSVFARLNPLIGGQYEILKDIGEVSELSKMVNIDLTLDSDVQRSIFSKTTKRYINKGRRLFTIRNGKSKEDILKFIDLYYENMDRVKAKPSYYFKEDYFHALCNSEEFETSILFAVDIETQELVSGAMMIKTNNIIQYHISGTKNEFLPFTPLRLLIDETRITGTNEKYRYFNLGGGLGSQEDSLFRFKASFSKDFRNFKVWKYIVDTEVYQNLKDEFGDKNDDGAFFPAYRNAE